MCAGEGSNITHSVHLVDILVHFIPKIPHKVFEPSRTVLRTVRRTGDGSDFEYAKLALL